MLKLSLFLAFTSALMAQDIVRLNANGLEKEGIKIHRLSQPSDPDPYRVAVENQSGRTILQFSLRMESDSPGPRGLRRIYGNNVFTGPFASGATGVGSGLGQEGFTQRASKTAARVSGPVEIVLDSVLWEDYSCSGPDVGHGCVEGTARMGAERDLMHEISTAGNVGDDAVLQALRDAGAGQPRHPTPIQDSQGTYDNYYAFYKQRVAQRYYNQMTPGSATELVSRARRNLETKKYPTKEKAR